MKSGLSLTIVLMTLISCSTPPEPALPEWVRQPARTVDNGYIVYVESDDDPSMEKARFKAEAMALQDLANECTLIPKGVRVEDRYDHKVGPLHESYAKVGVEMQLCEEAKHALTPEAIRKLANVPMTEQVKRYQDQIGQPEEVVASNEEEGEALSAQPSQPEGRSAGEDTHFYVVRQQIWLAKQDVILAPATAYEPQTIESKRVTERLTTQTQYLNQYEHEHPNVKTSRQAWGYYQHQLMRPKVNSQGNTLSPPPHPRTQNSKSGKHQNGMKRRRHMNENGDNPQNNSDH